MRTDDSYGWCGDIGSESISWQDVVAEIFMIVGGLTCTVLIAVMVLGMASTAVINRRCNREMALKERLARIRELEADIWGASTEKEQP
jgi:hypothetical protein